MGVSVFLYLSMQQVQLHQFYTYAANYCQPVMSSTSCSSSDHPSFWCMLWSLVYSHSACAQYSYWHTVCSFSLYWADTKFVYNLFIFQINFSGVTQLFIAVAIFGFSRKDFFCRWVCSCQYGKSLMLVGGVRVWWEVGEEGEDGEKVLVPKSLSCEQCKNGMEGKDEVLLNEIGTFVCFLSFSLHLFLQSTATSFSTWWLQKLCWLWRKLLLAFSSSLSPLAIELSYEGTMNVIMQ